MKIKRRENIFRKKKRAPIVIRVVLAFGLLSAMTAYAYNQELLTVLQ